MPKHLVPGLSAIAHRPHRSSSPTYYPAKQHQRLDVKNLGIRAEFWREPSASKPTSTHWLDCMRSEFGRDTHRGINNRPQARHLTPSAPPVITKQARGRAGRPPLGLSPTE
eukprot:5786158-Prymnesium_polylepis.1